MGKLFMSTNAPHRTTSEYSACGAESIERITLVKASISNHIIFIVVLGESYYWAIVTMKPCRISSEVIATITVGRKWVYSGKLTHECCCTFFNTSKQYQHHQLFINAAIVKCLRAISVVDVANLTWLYVGNLRVMNPSKFASCNCLLLTPGTNDIINSLLCRHCTSPNRKV